VSTSTHLFQVLPLHIQTTTDLYQHIK